jgi:hypothetical protein
MPAAYVRRNAGYHHRLPHGSGGRAARGVKAVWQRPPVHTVSAMGMFDYYRPVPAPRCPTCGDELTERQGKDADCLLLVWRQGERHPVGRRVRVAVTGFGAPPIVFENALGSSMKSWGEGAKLMVLRRIRW